MSIPAPKQRSKIQIPPGVQFTKPPSLIDTTTFIQAYFANPVAKSDIQNRSARLARAIEQGDLQFVKTFLLEKYRRDMKIYLEQKKLKEREIEADPDNQKKIEEGIYHKLVNENFENAIEHNPEAFGRVCMLYVPAQVNKTDIIAFVDSGAQSTIMSEDVAKKCGILHLLDTRFQGVAVGVGTGKIVGRVHACDLKIGNSFFTTSFTVMDNINMGFLLGLDNLKRHRCIIDLQQNFLCIGNEKVPFLPDGQCPKSDFNPGGEDNDQDPTKDPTKDPSKDPTKDPTKDPSAQPHSTSKPNSPSPQSQLQSTQQPSSSSTQSSSTQSSSTSAQQEEQSATAQYLNSDNLKALLEMGYSEDRAVEALYVANGDLETAILYLTQ